MIERAVSCLVDLVLIPRPITINKVIHLISSHLIIIPFVVMYVNKKSVCVYICYNHVLLYLKDRNTMG